ncbi:MAG: hypothetical protein B7Z18_05105, partial [Alishewanella sp. 32-51-5]
QRIYVVSNFTPIPRENFALGVAEEGEFEVILNTDSEYFWGSNYPVQQQALVSIAEAWQGQPRRLSLNLPPLATLYLRVKS